MAYGHLNVPGVSSYDMAQLQALINEKAPGTDITRLEELINGKESGKRFARFVVGTSTAGWTAEDCDYLCDGTEDNVEIQAAIDALPDTGGTVVILDGIYHVTNTTINLNKPNMVLTGQTGTVFHINTTKDACIFTIKAANVTLSGITAYCYNSGTCIKTSGSNVWARIINNNIYDAQYGCNVCGSKSSASIIANNVIGMSPGYTTKGIIALLCSDSVIEVNNTISGYKQGMVGYRGQICVNNYIADCTQGIDTSNAIIMGNYIWGCGTGICIQGSLFNLILGNYINVDSNYNSPANSIILTGSSGRNYIIHNFYTKKYPILDEATASTNVIENNYECW